MDACLATKTDYLDTANYEPLDTAKFEYKWQWAYREKFKEAGITAVLGCGFDPGVTGVFSAFAMKHYFDEIHQIDILDANAGDHGYPFATNFNPEINIREITANGSYYEDGKFIETDPLSIKKVYNFPVIGDKDIMKYSVKNSTIILLMMNYLKCGMIWKWNMIDWFLLESKNKFVLTRGKTNEYRKLLVANC
jgi:saccharopine dehydrogenase (NAD+, L-lysine-forming)